MKKLCPHDETNNSKSKPNTSNDQQNNKNNDENGEENKDKDSGRENRDQNNHRKDNNDDEKKKEATDPLKVKKWLKNAAKIPQCYALSIEHGFDARESIGYGTLDNLVRIGIDKVGH